MDEQDNEYEKLAYTQRLKAAIHFSVGQICEEVSQDTDVTFTKQVIAAFAEATFRQCETVAVDLELFAKHGKRSVINNEDVKLLARRSDALANHIKAMSDKLTAANAAEKEEKGKRNRKKKSTVVIDDE
ncbi:centromere protein S-like [Anneissia japonica]|uniref:centromere protein S-like n=1 Tax=Anneissia japonica TaxID=1529436 RepID=UPI0014258CDC|nr:centromere protein S-like [Anneissia japonica]